MASQELPLVPEQYDALHHMAQVGLGQATAALAGLTGASFGASDPAVLSLAVSNIPDLIGGHEEIALAVYMPFKGQASGSIAFMLTWESACFLWSLILGHAPSHWTEMTDLEESALREVGDIVNSSFLNALSDHTGLRLLSTPAEVTVEMARAIMSTIAAEAEANEALALSITTAISVAGNGSVDGYFLCIPTMEGLNLMFQRLGVAGAA